MAVATLDDLLGAPGVRGLRVFVRADLNVPLAAGHISDDSRIRAALPTLRKLLAAGARVVLASHLGRPGGAPSAELSLAPIAERLGELLGRPARFCPAVIGDVAEEASRDLSDGELLVLENLRFEPGETKNDAEFARRLAALADVYVNDAFGTAHRAHASTAGMVVHFETAAAGDLLRSELRHLGVVLEPERPLLCLLGGAKVSDKLSVLEALAPHADVLCIGGAMAYTFLRAQGEATGASLVEEDRLDDARRVLAAAAGSGRKVLLPTDHIVADRVDADAKTAVVTTIPEGRMGLDIGPETAERYAAEVDAASTVFWNGPMGVFELEPFAHGTERVATAIADSAAISVVGGGDSLAAIHKLGVGDRITHLSTGGGASLEYVQGLPLPGVTALERTG